jgi:protein-L-isoaspartate(D-aspartate) O-methyltransferase
MAPPTHDDDDFAPLRHQMVRDQLEGRGIVDPRVLRAMETVPRHLFVPERRRWAAYEDEPLAIGLGQTISQPYMVGRMTELLELSPGARVLEVGTGSGYQAAVLAELAAEVWTIERHAALAEGARNVLADLGYATVHVVVGDGSLGLPEHAPFAGIVVTAGAPAVPDTLRGQLAEGGRLVIPVGDPLNQWLQVVEKVEGRLNERVVLACRFVPLIGKEGFADE